MADFKDGSLWMKLALLFTVIAFGLCLFGMDTGGWASFTSAFCGNNGNNNNNGNCGGGWYTGVEACEVIAFITLLTALLLVLCLVLLDELKGNKIALICYVVFVLIAGLAAIIGVAIWGSQTNGLSSFSTMVTVMAGLCAILGGIFGILELVGVNAK